jgi:hypothetical protein
MSRAKIALVAAVLISLITAALYVTTTSKLEKKIKDDVRQRVSKARELLIKNASFDALDLMKRADGFARTPGFAAALSNADPKSQELNAAQSIREALSNLKADDPRPDFVALVNKDGTMIAIDPSGPFPTDWGKRYPAVGASIAQRRTAKDVWEWENAPMKVGLAPVVDRATNEILGAIVVAYPLNAAEAVTQASLLDMHVAYFFNGKVRATSFGKTGQANDEAVAKVLFENGLAKTALEKRASDVIETTVGGQPYMVSAGALPLNLSDKTSGAMVLMSLSGALEPVQAVKMTILLLGLAGLVISILGIFLTARLILGPAEDIELGVAEIINGNIDYQFRPVSADFDGLANALNVMLARLLGRAEPGEEEYDDQGNVIGGTAKVQLADAEPPSAADKEALALANEPEADYYRRLFNEFIDAKKKNGDNVEGVNFDGFTAKLRMNEASLKKKYSAKSVRFRVQVKDGQVTLKPVPIL